MPSQLLPLCFGFTQFDFAAESAASAALQLRAYALGVCVFMEARNVNAHADTPARCFSHAVVIDVNGCGMRKLLTCGSTQEHQPQAYFLFVSHAFSHPTLVLQSARTCFQEEGTFA